MAFYSEKILPRILDVMLSQPPIDNLRMQVLPKLKGIVLEIGIGTGLTIKHYSKDVTKVYAIDPNPGAIKIAQQRAERASLALEFVTFDSNNRLPIEEDSIDCLVSCLSLCTIPNAIESLRAIRPYLKRDSGFYFIEHGLSPDTAVAKWQKRMNPIQKFIFDGCHLDKDIVAILDSANFKIETLQNIYIPGPKAASYFYVGSAKPVITKEIR